MSHSGTLGQPALQDPRAGDRLEADHDDPEVPVQPADAEPRPAAEGLPGVVGERPGRGVRDRHLAEHPHDHDDQDAGDGVGQERGRADLADDRARADEQAGADDTADRDHREVALLEALLQVAVLARCVCHGPLLS